jgi:Fe-S cluster biogenesis protein NfuA
VFILLLENLPNDFYQISLTGGEPTISDYFTPILDIIRLYRKKFTKVVLTTNGTSLDKYLNVLNTTVDHVNISRHAISDAINNMIFGKCQTQSWALPNLFNKLNMNGIDVTLNAVLTPKFETGMDLIDYIRFAKEIGATNVVFRKEHGDLLPAPIEKFFENYKVVSEGGCPACYSKTLLINGMNTTFKRSVLNPDEVMNGKIYEVVFQPDGNLYSDWNFKNKIDIPDINADYKPDPEDYLMESCGSKPTYNNFDDYFRSIGTSITDIYNNADNKGFYKQDTDNIINQIKQNSLDNEPKPALLSQMFAANKLIEQVKEKYELLRNLDYDSVLFSKQLKKDLMYKIVLLEKELKNNHNKTMVDPKTTIYGLEIGRLTEQLEQRNYQCSCGESTESCKFKIETKIKEYINKLRELKSKEDNENDLLRRKYLEYLTSIDNHYANLYSSSRDVMFNIITKRPNRDFYNIEIELVDFHFYNIGVDPKIEYYKYLDAVVREENRKANTRTYVGCGKTGGSCGG